MNVSMRAVALGLAAMGFVAAADAAAVQSGWTWTPWTASHPRESWCRLVVTGVEEDHPADQVRIGLRNEGDTRLRATLRVVVDQGGHRMTTKAEYDNINIGEIRKADTDATFAGTIAGARIALTVTACSEQF